MAAFLYTAQSFSFHNTLALSDSLLLEFTSTTHRAPADSNRTEKGQNYINVPTIYPKKRII